MRTAITNVPGLVSWMDPENKAAIRHIGTHLQTSELFSMLDLDPERFPDMANTDQLQLMPIEGRRKEKFIYTVVEEAESKKQKPRRIDPQEYVDLLNQCTILEPCFHNEDGEWAPLKNVHKASGASNNPDGRVGWFVQLQKIKD